MGSIDDSHLLQIFQMGLFDAPKDIKVPHYIVSVEASSLLHHGTYRDLLVCRDNSLNNWRFRTN